MRAGDCALLERLKSCVCVCALCSPWHAPMRSHIIASPARPLIMQQEVLSNLNL